MIQWMLAIWSLVPLPFLKPAWTSESSQFTYCWSLAWRILSITLLACEMSATVPSSEHSSALTFFGIGMKTDLFQSCGRCWVFQICWHIDCSSFTASSFRIWNSSTVIPPPSPLLNSNIVGFLGGSAVKNSPAIQDTQAWLVGQEDPMEKEMATHSSILVWEIPWMEKPVRLQYMGSHYQATVHGVAEE